MTNLPRMAGKVESRPLLLDEWYVFERYDIAITFNSLDLFTSWTMASADERIAVAPEAISNLSISSRAIHADDVLNSGRQDVAPALHVSTTYRYASDPEKLVPYSDLDVDYLYPFIF